VSALLLNKHACCASLKSQVMNPFGVHYLAFITVEKGN